MIFGEYPYTDTDKEQLKLKILTRKICVSRLDPKQLGLVVTEKCLDLIDKMLAHTPEKRLAIIDVMHHPWLTNQEPAKDIDTPTFFVDSEDKVSIPHFELVSVLSSPK